MTTDCPKHIRHAISFLQSDEWLHCHIGEMVVAFLPDCSIYLWRQGEERSEMLVKEGTFAAYRAWKVVLASDP